MHFTDLFGAHKVEAPKLNKTEAKQKRAKVDQERQDLVAIIEDLQGGLDKARAYLEGVQPKRSERSVLDTRAQLYALLGVLGGELGSAKKAVQEILLPMMEEQGVTRLPVKGLGKCVEYQTYSDRKPASKTDLSRVFGEAGIEFWEALPVKSKNRLGLKNLDTL